MNLRSRKLERSLRRRTLAEMRASRALWQERKRLRKGQEYHLPPGLYRCIIFGIVILFFFLGSRQLNVLIAMTVLYSLGSIFFRAFQLQFQLYASPNLNALRYLPVSDSDIFRIQFKSFLRTSSWSALDFIFIYGVLAYKAGFGANSWIAGLGLGLTHSLVMLATALILIGYTRSRLFWAYGLFFMASPIPLAIFNGSFQTATTTWLTNHALWIPPLGWTLNILGIAHDSGFLASIWPPISIALVLLLMPQAYKRAQAGYSLAEPQLTPTAPQPTQAIAPTSSDAETEDPFAAVKQSIRERKFLTPFDWQTAGWLERVAYRWLTPEERLAAEFMSAGAPRWTARFTRFTWICGACVAGFIAIPQLAKLAAYISVYFVIYLMASFSLSWKGFELKSIGGSSSPLQALYPLSFWCLVRLTLKINLLRLVSLPLAALVFYVMMIRGFGGWSPKLTFNFMKVVLLFIGLQPLSPLIPFSSGSNDTQLGRPMLLLVTGGILVGGSGLALFMTSTVWGAVAMFAVLILVSTCCLLLYGHAYDRNWFDLMRKTKTQANIPTQ